MPGYTNAVGATAPAFQPEGKECAVAWNRATFTTGELTLNAVYPLVRLPRGAVVHDITLKVTDMDGATAGVVSVGVAGDTERYIRRVSIQTAGVFRAGNDATAAASMIAATPLANETTVDLLIQTAPGTPAAGTVDISVFYTTE